MVTGQAAGILYNPRTSLTRPKVQLAVSGDAAHPGIEVLVAGILLGCPSLCET